MKNKSFSHISISLVILLCLVSGLLGETPQTLSYQGVLTNSNGEAVKDSIYTLSFSLYDTPKAGSPLWTEAHLVALTDGYFNVILGSKNPLSLPFDKPYWLGIKIGNDSENEQRVELTASAYSLNTRSIPDSIVTAKKIANKQVVRSINSIKDDVVLTPGENINIEQKGNNLIISAKSKDSAGKSGSSGKKASGFGTRQGKADSSGYFTEDDDDFLEVEKLKVENDGDDDDDKGESESHRHYLVKISDKKKHNSVIIGTDRDLPDFLRLRPNRGDGFAITNDGDKIGVFVDAEYAKVGVGTSDPEAKLHLVGRKDFLFQIDDKDFPNSIGFGTNINQSNFMRLRTAKGDGFGITSFGDEMGVFVSALDAKVGIGTTTLPARFNISESGFNNAMNVQINDSTKFLIHNNGGTTVGSDSVPPRDGLFVQGEFKTKSNVEVGGDLLVLGSAEIRQTMDVLGDGHFFSNLDVDGILKLNNTTQSTAFTNGALIVAGGTGIAKNLNIGQNLDVISNSRIGGSLGIGTASPSNLKLHVSGSGTYFGNHLALFENTGSGATDGVAIKVSTASPDANNNFVTFIDGNNGVRGRIEGQNATDILTDPEYIFFTFLDAFELGLAIADEVAAAASANACAGVGVVACPPIASLIAGAAVKIAAQAGRAIATQAFLFDDLGVAYASSSGDYAEWLKRLDENEEIEAGDIVGVFGGKISKSIKGAQQILPVSLAPIVLGNMPAEGQEDKYEKVAFMGQVRIKVIGEVNEGDYIIPSGLNDGTGIAIAPEMMTADEYAKVVGRAWESSLTSTQKMVNVAIGLNNADVAALIKKQQQENQIFKTMLEQKSEEIKQTQSELTKLKTEVAGLKDLNLKLAQLEAALEKMASMNSDNKLADKAKSSMTSF